MRYLRTALPTFVTVVAVALGGAALTGGGAAASARTPVDVAPVSDLLAGSYRADFGRLSVAGQAKITNKQAPEVSGRALLGRTLTVSPGVWKPGKVDLAYAWYADSKKIKGATRGSYTAVDDVVGDVLSVRVTATKQGYRPASVTAEVGVVRGGKLTATTKPVIKGTAAAGRTLKVTEGSWSESKVSLAYTWLRGAKQVGTGKRYVVQRADAGKKVRATVTATKSGYRAGTATTAAVAVAR